MHSKFTRTLGRKSYLTVAPVQLSESLSRDIGAPPSTCIPWEPLCEAWGSWKVKFLLQITSKFQAISVNNLHIRKKDHGENWVLVNQTPWALLDVSYCTAPSSSATATSTSWDPQWNSSKDWQSRVWKGYSPIVLNWLFFYGIEPRLHPSVKLLQAFEIQRDTLWNVVTPCET